MDEIELMGLGVFALLVGDGTIISFVGAIVVIIGAIGVIL